MANTAVAKKEANEVATNDEFDYGEYAGAGMEGAPKEAYAIPFLSILQKGSPQVDEASGAYIEGAKAGMFYENVRQRLYDGKKGVIIMPCAYQWTFLRWGPRSGDGGGFKGQVSGDDVARMKAKRQVIEVDRQLYVAPTDGSQFNPNRADRLQEAHQRYCLLLDDDGTAVPVLLSIVSTQIRKSRTLAARIEAMRVDGPNGKQKPPTWAHKVRLTSVPETNDKGSWYGFKFDLEGLIPRSDPLFEQGAEFNRSVMAGTIVASEEHEETAAANHDQEDRF